MRSIILNIGTSCFVQCRGCYNHFGNSIKKQTTVSNDNIVDFIRELHKVGVRKVTIGGGDPLSRKDISDLLRSIHDVGMSINLDTVGTPLLGDASTIFFGNLLIPKISEDDIIPWVNIIGIPLDGSNNEKAMLFRSRRPNVFAEQLAIIRLLTSRNAKVCVNTVLNSHNKDDMLNLYEILAREKIFKWQIFQFMPIGTFGYRNRAEFLVDSTDVDCVKKQLAGCHSNFQIEFKSAEERKSSYLIVDDEGTAWLPTLTGLRQVVGNTKTDLQEIMKYVIDEK